jgi:triacylglycerol lipase
MSTAAPAQQHWYDLPSPTWNNLFYPTKDYQYFRQPEPSPDTADLKTTAAWMADASMLAYGRSGPDLIPSDKFDGVLKSAGLTGQRIGDWSPTAKGTQGFFASNPKFAILAFRGTEKSDWTDSLVDLMALPVKEDSGLHSPQGLMKTLFHLGLKDPILNPFSSTEVGVHAGFQFALNSVWDETSKMLSNYRAANPAAPVFFTGHSLGAALATLAIARFRGGKAALYTVGSPRAGNKPFCDEAQSRADLGIHRLVDNHDLVTTVPPKDLFYDHTSGLMHIKENGDIEPNGVVDDGEWRTVVKVLSTAAAAAGDLLGNEPPPPALVDHSPGRYCYFLWRWARGGQIP